ncbi:MAG: hypothetical protein K6C13_05145 [Oscillospiraceae bacterium]|nr:hypothetical protein [Oscillospiraceae bacterium]
MPLFSSKRTVLPIPEGFTAESVKIESSICTGEKTIGFYDPASKRLMYAEAVRSDKDIENFLRRYGIQDKEK